MTEPANPTPEALAPCPFCGREVCLVGRASGPSEGNVVSKFACFIACHCGGYSARAHQSGFGQTPEEAKAKAIAAWNTRAAAPHVSREAVRSLRTLVETWRARARLHSTEPGFFPHGQSSAFNDCAIELETALAAFPGEFGAKAYLNRVTAALARRTPS